MKRKKEKTDNGPKIGGQKKKFIYSSCSYINLCSIYRKRTLYLSIFIIEKMQELFLVFYFEYEFYPLEIQYDYSRSISIVRLKWQKIKSTAKIIDSQNFISYDRALIVQDENKCVKRRSSTHTHTHTLLSEVPWQSQRNVWH